MSHNHWTSNVVGVCALGFFLSLFTNSVIKVLLVTFTNMPDSDASVLVDATFVFLVNSLQYLPTCLMSDYQPCLLLSSVAFI